MLTNATITRIDVPGTASPSGVIPFVQGAAIAAAVAMDSVSRSQTWALGAAISGATAVLYVPDSLGLVIDKGFRVTAGLDGDTQALYQVLHVNPRKLGAEVSHKEVYVKSI